jgi:hypothetical protein
VHVLEPAALNETVLHVRELSAGAAETAGEMDPPVPVSNTRSPAAVLANAFTTVRDAPVNPVLVATVIVATTPEGIAVVFIPDATHVYSLLL